MKTCPNCKYVWPDEHVGQCVECGNPMAAVQANGSNDLQFRWANQIAQGRRENEQEASMKRGQYDHVSLDESIMDRARGMIVQREEVIYEEDGNAA